MEKREYQTPMLEELGSVQELTSQTKVAGSGDCVPGSEDILTPGTSCD